MKLKTRSGVGYLNHSPKLVVKTKVRAGWRPPGDGLNHNARRPVSATR